MQRILDRIVFFRVCEDRTIEEVGTLLALLRLWQGHPAISLYEKLNELIHKRRDLYNGLLFAEHECEKLVVSNKVLENIFKNINYPLSPHHFDDIGVEILGSIYERFLGKTIRLTKKQVRVEEKPEVRKAGGVYYTPQYIVNYIVENTVGKLLYGETDVGRTLVRSIDGTRTEVRATKLTPRQVAKLKIIDIACGSGSFLLGAFQMLINYHVRWYTEHPKEVKEAHGTRDAYEDAQGVLHLSARKKREILVNNIYGVDIDPQAVEVTQMSLYLKVLEDENDATLNKPTMLALHEVLLPPLKDNIKCGNSLIGTDFFAQGELFDEESRRKVNPFDWNIEFKEIMEDGGFDCVIGNPLWISLTGRFRNEILSDSELQYLIQKYGGNTYMPNIYEYFVCQGLRLIKKNCFFSFIVPDRLAFNSQFVNLRKKIVTGYKLKSITFKAPFPGITADTMIFVIKGGAASHGFKSQLFEWGKKGIEVL